MEKLLIMCEVPNEKEIINILLKNDCLKLRYHYSYRHFQFHEHFHKIYAVIICFPC